VQRCLDEYHAINVWSVDKRDGTCTVYINDLEF
jgi:hypothetical protein